MAAVRDKKPKKKVWILIICVVVCVLLLTLCCRCCASNPMTTSSAPVSESIVALSKESVTTSEDAMEKTDSAEAATSVSRNSVESKEDLSSESDTESREESAEQDMTTEEATSTLPEEITEEAATTLEGNTEKTEPATTKEKETTKSTSGQNPTPGATTTAATPKTTKATVPAPTTTAAPQPTTTAAPTQPAHTHNFKGTVTKVATCGAAGVMTYTCSCGKSYTEAIPATGNHNWIESMNCSSWDLHVNWSYFKGLMRYFSLIGEKNILTDETKFVLTNMTFLNTKNKKDLSDDILPQTISHTVKLKEIIKPKMIVFLDGGDAFGYLNNLKGEFKFQDHTSKYPIKNKFCSFIWN